MMKNKKTSSIPSGVMFNAYPDSIGTTLADTIAMLKKEEFKDVFSSFYILPTFFRSDLDRGFSITEYELNDELVSQQDLKHLSNLGIKLKLDIVLNHLSVGSPQFRDMLRKGDDSEFKDFFIDWNEFWKEQGEMSKEEGLVMPSQEDLDKLFMRKPGLPILKVRFPDGTLRPYWNTFYQEITYPLLSVEDLSLIEGITPEKASLVHSKIKYMLSEKLLPTEIDWSGAEDVSDAVIELLESQRSYLGQMDLNAQSEKVWDFYEDTFQKLEDFGCVLVRLDAFAYLHKEPGRSNFFNKPETWQYLERLKKMAAKHNLILLPEIHTEYGKKIHEEVSNEGYPIYDFFFPGLVIDAIDRKNSSALLKWAQEIIDKDMKTVNMLGCHDGIPVLDLQGSKEKTEGLIGLLSDEVIDSIVERIISRGGRVKNLYGPDGKKISYYQVNATFFSALGESEQKLLIARAIQMFMPGVPQVWYLDLFAGTNDYAAADSGGTASHKEINRTTLSLDTIEDGLEKDIVKKQLALLRLRNMSSAFEGQCLIKPSADNSIEIQWINNDAVAALSVDLKTQSFRVTHKGGELGDLVIE